MNAITIDGVTQTRTMQFFAFVSNGKEKDYESGFEVLLE